MTPTVAWFRRDLRLNDNPAFNAACAPGGPVTALFVLDERLVATGGAARQALLLDHLASLDASLRALGGRLRIERGPASAIVARVAAELGAASVHWNADVTPFAQRRDAAVASALTGSGVAVDRHWGTFVHRPGLVLTGKGTLSQVFTPFWKRWDAVPWEPWTDAPGSTPELTADPGAGLPSVDAAPPIPGGEDAATDRLMSFCERADRYVDDRDTPSILGTSYLSSDLRFGTLSPRAVATTVGVASEGRAGFVRQLAWRDWYAHLLAENPQLPNRAIRADYDKVTWLDDDAGFSAWCEGRTGYPIVDAGMRELAATGWMHNRVRMITGSFLVKDLLIDWRRGERFFRHHLIDADVAQNAGNWQWVAGTGPDAAPYFRVFNPTTQSRKFDPEGSYLRRWVPELADLSNRTIHAPWEAAPLDLAAAGVTLGAEYPHPIVDHAAARERVLTAYKKALGKL